MRDMSKFEKCFFELIREPALKLSLEQIRKNAEMIWASDVRIIRDYTDHGYAHSERIFQKLFDVLGSNKNLLEQEEVYLLMMGVYLHDIGMQCDIKKHDNIKKIAEEKYGAKFDLEFSKGTANSYLVIEQNAIRNNHHLLTAAWIDYSYHNNESVLFSAVNSIDPIYLEDLIQICMFHSKLNIMECCEKTDMNKIRRRLVAALLRFGDELDIDQYRVDINTVEEFSFEIENSIYWYLHSRTQIKIMNNEVILTVNLNPEDIDYCSKVIDKLVIRDFKDKNKVLTDLLTQNNIPVFISEKSKVNAHQFTQRLPLRERDLIIDLGKKKIAAEYAEFQNLIDSIKDSKSSPEQITRLIAGEVKVQEFAQKHKYYVKSEVDKLNALVQTLKYKYMLSAEDVDSIISVFEKTRRDNDYISKYPDYILGASKAFLFIQAFTKRQLTFLYDIGAKIHIQICQGSAQSHAIDFFSFYFAYKMKNSSADILKLFDDYTFEQIIRILRDYLIIVNFDFSKIEFSTGYLYSKEKYGNLLAATLYGESNKIIIWDIDSGKYEPIAALGGLYERVKNLKISRADNQTIITVVGAKQIYLWNLTLGNEYPSFIFQLEKSIEDYSIIKSINNKLYVIGLSQKTIYLWEINGSEHPVNSFPASGEVFIINTRLSLTTPVYDSIGIRSGAANMEFGIYALIEDTPLKFRISKIISKQELLGESNDEMYFVKTIHCYNICKLSGILGVLIGADLYFYDTINLKKGSIIKDYGQRVLDFNFLYDKSITYLLAYCIYQQRFENQSGLIRCFRIDDNNAVGEKQWFYGKADINAATMVKAEEGFNIFFNQYYESIIYKIDYNSDNYEKFIELPESFQICELVSG